MIAARRYVVLSFFTLTCVAWFATSDAAAQATRSAANWYKGNLHTHTIHSDGDSSPEEVARWYKEHRYQFVALTDHNYFTDPGPLQAFLGADERFLLIGGEEVTSKYEAWPVHVNAFQVRRGIEPQFGENVIETIQRNVDAIRAAGAIPSLNHPNFRWGVSAEELRSIEGLKLFEVYNGHPATNDFGSTEHVGLEEMWDMLLSSGRKSFGIAVDDAHVFKTISPTESNPGRGWISVQAPDLSTESIMGAIDRGNFYSSTGVELVEMSRGGVRLSFTVDAAEHVGYTTKFIGRDGRVLEKTGANPASLDLPDGEPYLRAVVTDSNGLKAWVQPIFRGD